MLVSIFVTLSSIITALVAAGTAYLVHSHNQPCSGGVELVWIPMLHGDEEVSVNACDYFSDNYTQARDRFHHAVQLIPSAKLESHLIYTDTTHQEQYHMDICVLPGSQPGLVIHTSGVHGVEGYAGSAIQLALLDSPSLKTKNADRPTLVLVHAVNPYGMAHYRRVNEHNVDLNRNALSPHDFNRIQKRHNTSHQAYRQLEPLFNPQQAPTLWNAYVSFVPRITWNLYQHGLASIKAAMVSGQYYNERGIFYGGAKLEPSTAVLEQWLTKYMSKHAGHANTNGESHRDTITWIDVHTGLGPTGRDTLLPGRIHSEPLTKVEDGAAANRSTNWIAYYAQQLQRWYPKSLRANENTVASGYEEARGLYGMYFDDRLRAHDAHSMFFVQEFGTIPSILVGHALMVENAAFHYGGNGTDGNSSATTTSAVDWAKRTMLPAFYLQHPDWRRSILQQGVRVAWQSLERSQFYSTEAASESVVDGRADEDEPPEDEATLATSQQ